MDRVGAASDSNPHNFDRVEIAVDRVSFIGAEQVQGARIGYRKYSDGLNSHLGEGLGNPNRDFAAIGDEDLSDHLLFVLSIQGGFWRSRKALIPACPSSPARARAIASAVNSTALSNVRAATPKTSSLAAAIAPGADVRI